MSAICNVIYGVPLIPTTIFPTHDELIAEELKKCTEGFLLYYSGYSFFPPAAFGIKLDKFSESDKPVNLSEITGVATEEQIKEYENNYSNLSEEVKLEIDKNGTPRVFLLWSTS